MLKKIEISGFKSFAKKTTLSFDTPVTAIVGPNGSGKSNVVESFRFALGEQSMKSLRGKGGNDLIWKGSKLLASATKAKVGLTFDNGEKKFIFSDASGAGANLDFDEVTLTREVTQDGGSNYSINGSNVRLKDLTELLGSVNIGATGHHIISQGEADRLLSASPRDRRGMVEEALGLKVFQTRIRDSERKLEKTTLNMKETQSLRRELAPHLNFLAKQVEKIEKSEELRKEFGELFKEYAKAESSSIHFLDKKLVEEEIETRREYVEVKKNVNPDSFNTHDEEKRGLQEKIRNFEFEQSRLFREKEELGRAIGRIEGKLDAVISVKETSGPSSLPAHEVKKLCDDLIETIKEAQGSEDLFYVKNVFGDMLQKIESYTNSISPNNPQVDTENLRLGIEKERAELEIKLSKINFEIEEFSKNIRNLREQVSLADQRIREKERDSYANAARLATIEGIIREQSLRREALTRRGSLLAQETKEAEIFLGQIISQDEREKSFSSKNDYLGETVEAVAERESLKRKIERIKIRLEDAGTASGAEIMKEYEETKNRDAFLLKELADLEAGIISLRNLISELRITIERSFKEGVEKINKQFGDFFQLMFGGGGAFLSIIVEHKRINEDDEVGDESMPFEHGLDINVTLPRKKVKDLAMLSGGERSLVSIALLFAMSQVNPPPFLVLDETDAALDEANSRKYGDMLELLSKHSKLIVVTHNRETMSRAQVLYGVTMGMDGSSKLLSIKFEEAVQIAK